MEIKEEHLKDIDFRTREARQENSIEEFKHWYNVMWGIENKEDRHHAQLQMLSAVLWHLLPKNEYKKFMRIKPLPKKDKLKYLQTNMLQ